MRPSLPAVAVSLFAVAASQLLACSPPPPCGAGGIPPPAPMPAMMMEPLPYTRVGVPFTHNASLQRFGVCEADTATSVRAEVKDPFNANVEATAELVGANNPPSALVTFTPLIPGAHHVTVRFDPSMGDVQTDVLAVRDLATFSPRQLPFTCYAIQRVGTDGVLCDARVIRADGSTAELPVNTSYIASGEVIWGFSTAGDRVTRWTVPSTGPAVLSGQLAVSNLYGVVHALATPEAVVVAASSKVARYVFANGAIQAAGQVPLDSPSGMIRSGDELHVAANASTVDGGATTEVCRITASASALTLHSPCESFEGLYAGVEGSTLWLRRIDTRSFSQFGEPKGSLVRLGAEGAKVVVRSVHKLSDGYSVEVRVHGGIEEGIAGGPPLILRQTHSSTFTYFVPRADGGELSFDLLAEDRRPPQGVGPQLAWIAGGVPDLTFVFQREP